MLNFIPVSEPSITRKEIDYVADAMKSGWVSSLGKYINEFEKGFSEFTGTRYALTVSNGTAALHLALAALGIHAGDEVIVPDLTFIATANAVTYTGARPVAVDVETDTWCMDPDCFRKAITKKTRAVIPVHLYGHPVMMDEVMEIAGDHGLSVIEDCAEAHGAKYKNRRVGSIGNVGVFSFYGNKIMTTGEGGMLTTDDEKVYERARYLRDHAMSVEKRYWHTEVGFNYRMTNIQAAMGLAQLERIEELIEKKRRIFGWYRSSLKDVEGVVLNPQMPWAENVYWMICLLLKDGSSSERDSLMAGLRSQGIDSRPFFYPVSSMPMYATCDNQLAQIVAERGLNLPSSVNLSEKGVKLICAKIQTILKCI